jgi:hypothetical protein
MFESKAAMFLYCVTPVQTLHTFEVVDLATVPEEFRRYALSQAMALT